MTNKIPPEIIDKLPLLVVSLAFMVFYLFLGKMDYEDALNFEKQYIQDVCNKVHPNYKNWEIDCTEGKLK